MGGKWACSFSRRGMEPEEPLGWQPSAEVAKEVAEQHAQAHQCQPLGPWIQAESAWFLVTSCSTYVVARAPAAR
jgi:hypothetical protein